MTINSSINIIGSISDYELILRILELHFRGVPKDQIKTDEEIFSPITFRTQSSKTRVLNGVLEGFGKTINEEHSELLAKLFAVRNNTDLKNLALYLQLIVNNELFFLITKNVFIKKIFSGAISIKTDDIESYLYSLRVDEPTIKNWSNSTIHTVAYKYLIIMKKFGFAEGKATKEFIPFMPNYKEVLYFLYFIKSIEKNKSDFFSSRYIDFIFLTKEALFQFLKSIDLKEFISIETTGSEVLINLNLSNEEFVNELLSQRSQAEI